MKCRGTGDVAVPPTGHARVERRRDVGPRVVGGPRRERSALSFRLCRDPRGFWRRLLR